MDGDRQIGFGTVVLFGLVACLLYGVPAGLRGDVGILLNPLAGQTGLAEPFLLPEPLVESVIEQRRSQFTMQVAVGGEPWRYTSFA